MCVCVCGRGGSKCHVHRSVLLLFDNSWLSSLFYELRFGNWQLKEWCILELDFKKSCGVYSCNIHTVWWPGVPVGVTPSPKRRLSRTSSRDREREREKDTGDGGSLSNTLGRGTNDMTPNLSSLYPQVSHAGPAPPTLSVPSIGFIMCECGLEDVSVTAVRRLGYQDTTQEAQEVGNDFVFS